MIDDGPADAAGGREFVRSAAGFRAAPYPDPSPGRAQRILAAHPEVRALIGPAPSSFVWLLGLLAVQLATAGALAGAPWWLVVVVAYTLGAVLTTGLFSMIHEASHGVIFRRRTANRLVAFLANLGTVLPAAESFMRYHIDHHTRLGVVDEDVSIPATFEARWVGRSPWRKLLWVAAYPVIYPLRFLGSGASAGFTDRWMIANIASVVAFDLVVLDVWGVRALAYLALSFLFAFGLHPFSAMNMQEHGDARAGQDSYSYYGPANLITFNAGYHLEHHDFPRVPWLRRPRLRRIAPEFYRDQFSYRSWTRLLIQFIIDPRWDLWRRSVRPSRSG